MAKRGQAGQTWRARWLAFGSLGLTLTLASGCSGPQHATGQPHDPLHGVLVPPGLPQPGGAKTAGAPAPISPQAYNPGGVPAQPAALKASNPATLAGASWQGPHGKATPMGDDYKGPPLLPGRSTLGNQPPNLPAPNPNPKVEQVPDATSGKPLIPTAMWQSNSPIPPPGEPTRAELLLKRLQDRGVVNQKQDLVPEGIHLTCYITRGEGAGLRILEATAADYPSAAQAILQQLERPR